MEYSLINLDALEIRAAQAEIVTWHERKALRLENGLALIREHKLKDASIELLIGTEGPAYPGVAFRVTDVLNYELVYAVPHVSGQWDALQYDPVFHGSNTWQLHHGPGYQREAQVPMDRWFQLKVDFSESQAAASVDGQPSLFVQRLAHSGTAGRFGVWTFRPAYFCDLQVSSCEGLETRAVEGPGAAEGVVGTWFVENYGVVACEPNGVVNLNRYLPTSLEKARLVRRFEVSEEAEITFEFGYSDELTLELDGKVICRAENTFRGFEDRVARGYAELGTGTVRRMLETGSHHLTAEVSVSEGFGWGLVLAAHGPGLRWLPAELG
jgi:hypothetical protein